MKFNAKVYQIKLDKGSFQRDFDSYMREVTKEAARSWLRTVTVIVPVWSKASRATFTKLANKVGHPMSFLGANPRLDRQSFGASHGEGGLKFQRLKAYYFFYETDLRWLVWNNFNRAVKGDGSGIFYKLTKPTPYRFEIAGRADFESFAQQVKPPHPVKYIKGKKI